MSAIAIPASCGTADQQLNRPLPPSTHRSSPLPEIRLPVDARGLALGIVAVFASVLALWLAQAFVVPLLLGIPLFRTR